MDFNIPLPRDMGIWLSNNRYIMLYIIKTIKYCIIALYLHAKQNKIQKR